jgi:hypothetical protein
LVREVSNDKAFLQELYAMLKPSGLFLYRLTNDPRHAQEFKGHSRSGLQVRIYGGHPSACCHQPFGHLYKIAKEKI